MIRCITYDYNNHREIKQLFLNYINVSINYNVKSTILGLKQKKLVNSINEELKINGDTLYQSYVNQSEELCKSYTLPYCILFSLLKLERKLIMQYNDIIKEL